MAKLGLALAGGSITGAMYEVGCLAALEDGLEQFRMANVDLFVGVSTGATVAAALAGGVGALRLYRALLDPGDDFFPLERKHLLRLDGSEWLRMGTTTVAAARRLLSSVSTRPFQTDFWTELERFQDSLPAGIFSLDGLELFLREVMVRRGIPTRFADFGDKLVVVASDLDDGRRALFGRGDLTRVPVPRALVASLAVPVLYAPVRIDGRDYVEGTLGEVANADVLVDAGCDTVLIVDSLVPVRVAPESRDIPTGHGKMRRVRDKGALWVFEQAWRVQAEARLEGGLARYRAMHPDVRIALIRPDASSTTMFMYSPMNYAARRVVLEEAYTSTLRALRDPGSTLREVLVAHGLRVKA